MSKRPHRPRASQSSDAQSHVSARIEEARLNGKEALSLSHSELTKLPESIGELTHLRILHLTGNHLTRLPESIGRLARLEYLDVSDNKLTELPDSLGSLKRLETLDLWGNRLSKLPESIYQMTGLRRLNLSNNQLTQLPSSVGRMARLRELYLSENRLAELPESIGDMRGLKKLYLSGNHLTRLPESIGRLSELRALILEDNRLTTLPESLRALTSLKKIVLKGNPSLDLLTEMLEPLAPPAVGADSAEAAHPTDLLEYYFKVRGGKRPLNEAKLILVGRGAVGKTSLVNRLVHDRFDKDEKRTDGINITEWPFRLNEQEQVRLNVWDFGGQEIMYATHQFFLTQRSLYLLVLSGREGGEDDDADYWLRIIESFGGDSPVIVVMNKIKAHPFDLNRRALQKKHPSVREFVKTDCEEGIGIEDLRRAVKRETDRLENLRASFPANWFSIKYQIAGMKKNYLSFNEYRKLCARHGEKDPDAQETLASYLHVLGTALNFRDDPRLGDTHVLNPRWVTEGIYQILVSDTLERQKGEIRLGDLAGILSDDYPANMRRFILDLMKRFELCFSFPNDDTHYLIPELLDKQEPDEVRDFDPEECLSFQYHYPVLPEGLLPRFIVRTHALSEGLPRWRTGVILKFEGNRALVKADASDRKVFIYVSGPAAGRRRLLAVIRSDFDRIHRDIRNLQPQRMVPLPGRPDIVVPYQELLAMERGGVNNFPKVVDGRVVKLDVYELLNGVDLADAPRRQQESVDEAATAVRLFYSYSHKDEEIRDQLETHLKLLQQIGLLETWHDRRIEGGEDFGEVIDDNLERADVILLLVSADFMASPYCYQKEMRRALERHERKEARVIPVIVRDLAWSDAPFAKLKALPKDGRAVTLWADRDSAWRNVAEEVRRVIEGIRDKRSMQAD